MKRTEGFRRSGVSGAARLLVVLFVGTLLAGCSSEEEAPGVVGDGDVHLTRCASCDSLESYLKGAAVRMVTEAYTDPGGCYRFGVPGAREDSLLPPVPTDAQLAEGGHSTTNVQEPGVDEPDFVKNDGTYVYVLNGSDFLVYDVVPPTEAGLVGSLELAGTPMEMFVRGETAAVFSSFWGPVPIVEEPEVQYGLKITLIDLADRTDPRITREFYVEGSYMTARLVDGMVHVLVSGYLDFPRLDFSLDLSQNLARIRRAKLASWIPSTVDVRVEPGAEPEVVQGNLACDGFYLPDVEEIHAILTILSFDLEDPGEGPTQTSIPSPTGIAYASAESIYVSHIGVSREDCGRRTRIHKFDIATTPGQPIYRGSGKVDGWLLNSFSMGEQDGFLRVATTEGMAWGPAGSLTNDLFVLGEDGENLEVVGEVRNIAPGETIYSARFLGDVGFMVTFERIDPLFTFDLSDPTSPQLLGELEVAGVSNYIHPVGEDHLLTIGQDAEDAGPFSWFQGVQVSVYDISDLADPTLTDMQVIGDRGTSSEALYDHKAYNYYGPKDILAFPIQIYEGGGGGSEIGELTFVGFQVYDVDLAEGYSLRGQVDHDAFYEDGDCSFPWMRRTMVIDNALVTLSNAGMKIHDLDDLSTALASLPFPSCGVGDREPWPVPF